MPKIKRTSKAMMSCIVLKNHALVYQICYLMTVVSSSAQTIKVDPEYPKDMRVNSPSKTARMPNAVEPTLNFISGGILLIF